MSTRTSPVAAMLNVALAEAAPVSVLDMGVAVADPETVLLPEEDPVVEVPLVLVVPLVLAVPLRELGGCDTFEV